MAASVRALSNAARCGRVPVSVAAFAASALNGDAHAYWFRDEAEELGLECWALIEGVDSTVSGESFDVWLASGAMMVALGGEEVIFVAAKHAALIPAGAPRAFAPSIALGGA